MKSTKLLRITMVAAIAAALLASAGAALAASCNVPSGTYPTIQSAVNAPACSTINVARGTYTEQVTIARSLTLNGAGVANTVIKAPAVLAPDADGFHNIVEIKSGATVKASNFVVAGPGSAPCSLTSGIAIIGGALLDIDHAAVRDIRDEPVSDCSSGYGIRAGYQPGGPPDVGHLKADHLLVTGYQREGIDVYGAGSTGQISSSTIQGTPSSLKWTNGIGASNGALVTINQNTISGNRCSAPNCGPDWFTQIQSFGISAGLIDAGSTISNNDIFSNDGGIGTSGGGDIDHNDVSANGDFGLVLDSQYAGHVHDNKANGMNASCPAGVTSCDGILIFATGARFNNNNANSNGHNGIEVSCYPGPACGTGNTIINNSMTGNGSFDAKDSSSGSGTAGTANTWTGNNCTTSSPAGLCN